MFDVEVNSADGHVRVTRVVVAHDCGLITNPDGLRNQIEGNVIQAISRTLKEEVKFDRAMVTSLDWSGYPILGFPEIPEVVIELINHPNQPSVGAGEATTSAIPAAIANAIFNATNVRLRTIPFTLGVERCDHPVPRDRKVECPLFFPILTNSPIVSVSEEVIRLWIPHLQWD
jgi:CO/xanthine dehydrogenase Mo-binding subunit